MFQPAVHVAKGVLVGHQFDKALPAVRVQRQNFLAREGRRLGPDHRMALIGKGMLGVELELVELERGQQIDQRHRRFERRHAVTADVEHDAPVGKIGPVGAAQRRQRRAMLQQKLAQRLDAIEDAGRGAPHNHDTFGRNRQVVAHSMRGDVRGNAQLDADGSVGRRLAGHDGPGHVSVF